MSVCKKGIFYVSFVGKSEAYINYCRKEDHLFVETEAYFEAKDMLEKHNVVNILGGSGEGKTALLKHLTLHLAQQEFTPLEITRPEEIEENYTEDKHFLFVCDDPFGGPYLQQDSVNNWVRIGKSVEKYLLNGTVKIAFASRKNIWADCDKCLGDVELFCYTVEVASQRLTSEEKRQMLRLHFGEKFSSLSEDDIISITELESPIAFPYCCKLVSSCEFKDLCFDRLFNTFRRPFGLLAKELGKMLENSPWKFSVLVVIMLSGGALACDQFNASDASSFTKAIVDCTLDSCGIVEASRPFGQLKKCAESLTGTFLNHGQTANEEDVYCFSHDSIFEAVAMEYGKGNISAFLKFSDAEWIVSVCRPQNYERHYTEAAVIVHKGQYKKLAEKFTKQVFKGSAKVSKVFSSPCLQDQVFQKAWIEVIKASQKQKEFMQLEDWRGMTVLYWAASVGAGEIVRFLLANGSCCKCDNPYYHPLVGASRGGNLDELSLLLDSNTPQKVIEIAVEDAAYSGCWETVNRLFSVETDICRSVVGTALFAATIKGHKDVVSFLMNHCPNDEDIGKAFVEACKKGHSAIIQHFLCVKKDACSSKTDEGFIGAAGMGQILVLKSLFEKGISEHAIENALVSASASGQESALRFILSQELPENTNIHRSLISSSSVGDVSITRFLLEFSPPGSTVAKSFIEACQFDHMGILQLLYEHKPDVCKACVVDAMENAAKGNAMKVMKFLLSLNPPNIAIERALVSAARYGNAKTIKFLCSLSNELSTTALETAFLVGARKGQCKIVKYLLEQGVDINALDDEGKSALQLASEHWKINVVNLLLSRGAKQTDCS